MLRTVPTTALLTIVLLTGATAQEPQPVPPPAQQPPPPSAPPSRTPAQLVNIRLDITITDQRGDAAPVTKAVTLVIADRESGRIRSEGRDTANRVVTLNVDGRTEIVREGRMRAFVTLEYRPQLESGASVPISESIAAILEDGKPLVVSQSADPASDRKVRVELRATVLK